MRYRSSKLMEGMSELDIDNLKCGRITRNAMSKAARIAMQHEGFDIHKLGVSKNISTISDMILADCVNDLLSIGKELSDV